MSPFSEPVRDIIRRRDKWECQDCSKSSFVINMMNMKIATTGAYGTYTTTLADYLVSRLAKSRYLCTLLNKLYMSVILFLIRLYASMIVFYGSFSSVDFKIFVSNRIFFNLIKPSNIPVVRKNSLFFRWHIIINKIYSLSLYDNNKIKSIYCA